MAREDHCSPLGDLSPGCLPLILPPRRLVLLRLQVNKRAVMSRKVSEGIDLPISLPLSLAYNSPAANPKLTSEFYGCLLALEKVTKLKCCTGQY